eukprot:CAMPEP_0173424384 /NCGR_PEP_ID=MMETSP1357-20121228/4305_1 /TAXON_ID=77926 /ORGANISM="Hemiselmis rufescens, Strain PCC563" /LENGTH=282 /DNA_ID=CAMNT_0014387599 /DNA_START=214 /DNA_END=1062 /DNA_ORIENTATION=+
MAAHIVAIPSLEPVPNVEQHHGSAVQGQAGFPVPAAAAPIQEGDVLNVASVGDAAEDTKRRKKLKSVGMCTSAEVGRAAVREVQVAIAVSTNMAGAPAWAMKLEQQMTALQQQQQQQAAALQQQQQQQTAALQQQVAALQEQQQQQAAALQQQMGELQQQTEVLLARQQNNERQAHNARQQAAGQGLLALYKTVSGHPQQQAPQAASLQALVQPVPLGELPPVGLNFLPAAGFTVEDIMGLTVVNLNDLQWFYNQLFEGNNVIARRNSFLRFLVGNLALGDV